MPLNVVSNYAANVAHRNLQMNDTAASSSLAKLSVGKRVVSARDDAASLAIGQRLSAEVMGLKQAVVNSGQANSMLQIADGAMSTASDILTRMKVLAIQSSSGNLSATERDFLNTEYQALISEVDRIADDTDFAGTKLLDGSISITQAAGFTVTQGVSSITAQGVDPGTAATGGQYSISFASAATGGTFTITTTSGTYTGTIDSDAINTSGALTRATTIRVTDQTTNNYEGSFTISLNTAFAATTSITTAATQAFSGTSSLDLSFKLGTGTDSEDSLSFTLDAINTSSLGLSSTGIDTEGTASSGARGGQQRHRYAERVPFGRGCRAEPARLRLRQSQHLRRERRSCAKHAGRSRHRSGDDEVFQQAGPDAGRCRDAGPGQPDAAEPAASAAVVG